MISYFKATMDDKHPDAHACRLKIVLITMDTPFDCPFDIVRDMEGYLSKQSCVSAACRLTTQEERSILEVCEEMPTELVNRMRYHQAMDNSRSGSTVGTVVQVVIPRPVLENQFDTLVDKSFSAEFCLNGYNREAVGLNAAISAAFTNSLINKNPHIWIFQLPFLASSAFFCSAGLLEYQYRCAGNFSQFFFDANQVVTVIERVALELTNGFVAAGVVGNEGDSGNALAT